MNGIYNPRMRNVEKQPTFSNWFPPNRNTDPPQDASLPDVSQAAPVPIRRKRGRPRVNSTIDTAAERRRAQVREAQRNYQKRKDLAVASEKTRSEEVLEAVSDLSGHIEALLETSATSGFTNQENEVAERVRQLWKSYHETITRPCMGPELRVLQRKNDRRRENFPDLNSLIINAATRNSPSDATTTSLQNSEQRHQFDVSDMTFTGITDSTLIQPFGHVQKLFGLTGRTGQSGKSIMGFCEERLAHRMNTKDEVAMRNNPT